MNENLKTVASSIDVDRVIKKNFGQGFNPILIVLQDRIYNRFKSLYPQEFDEFGFDSLWSNIEKLSEDLLQDWLEKQS